MLDAIFLTERGKIMTQCSTGVAMRDSKRAGARLMRNTGQFLLVSMATFAGAFALRYAFFRDVKPVSWDEAPPQNGALEAAFLLLSIENIAAIVFLIALVLLIANWIKHALARTIH